MRLRHRATPHESQKINPFLAVKINNKEVMEPEKT